MQNRRKGGCFLINDKIHQLRRSRKMAPKRTLDCFKGNRIFFADCLLCAMLFFSLGSSSFAQWVSIPDSEYAPNEMLIWFRPGVLNYTYFGCSEEGEIGEPTEVLPLDINFIRDPYILDFLNSLNVIDITRVFPSLLPCRDTVSIARRGDNVTIPDFWNILKIRFNKTDLLYDAPNLCYIATVLYQNSIKLAEPNLVVRFTAEDGPDKLQKTNILQINDVGGQAEVYEWDPNRGRYGTQLYSLLQTIPCGWARVMGAPHRLIGLVDDGIDSRHMDFGSNGEVVFGGWNYLLQNDSTDNFSFHGTRIGGIIGALKNNNYGVGGIVGGSRPNANDYSKLVALKIGDGKLDKGNAYVAPGISAIVDGSTRLQNSQPNQSGWGCDVLNCSWTTMVPTEMLRAAIVYAYMNDVVVVAALPNKQGGIPQLMDYESPNYPAGCDSMHVISVGGYYHDQYDPNSVVGGGMDFLSPMSNHSIGALFYPTYTAYDTNAIGYGTSYATAHCTGIVSLLLGYRDSLESKGYPVPSFLTPEDVTMVIAEGTSVPPYPRLDGLPISKDEYSGYGILNAERALEKLATPFSLVHDSIEFQLDPGSYVFDSVAIAFPSHDRPLGSITDAMYEVRKYKIETDIYFQRTYPHARRIWSRGKGSTGAFPDIRQVKDSNGIYVTLPLYRTANSSTILNFKSDKARVETFVYQFRRDPSSGWQWLEIDSTNLKIKIQFSVLNDSNYTVAVEEVLPCTSSFMLSSIYPNPITGNNRDISVLMSPGEVDEYSIYIYNMLGECVWFGAFNNNLDGMIEHDIYLGKVPPGIYHVLAVGEGALSHGKLVVLK